MHSAQQILSFWFDGDAQAQQRRWFGKDELTDARMRDEFLADYQAAADGRLAGWQESAPSGLALVLLLDQFPRNLFRATPQAFATDAQARHIARFGRFPHRNAILGRTSTVEELVFLGQPGSFF